MKNQNEGAIECFTMTGRTLPNFLMPEPETPDSPPQPPALQSQPPSSMDSLPPLGVRIFVGPDGIRAIWRALLYITAGVVVAALVLWLGGSFFSGATPVRELWSALFSEVALALGALVPAFFMARIEKRPFDDYGLPAHAAFGRQFWIGAAWGLGGMTLLLLALRGVHVFDFGFISLHGSRVLRFAAFWGLFFLVVALFEEFAVRGYLMFLLAGVIGFWPAAVFLSCVFGAIHLMNRQENIVGALGAAVIGLFLCLTLQRTGNLWFAVGFHTFWDWGETFLYGVPDSGTTAPGHVLSPSFHGPDWLTGGIVGPEASALCFVLVALLILAFHRVYPLSRYISATHAAQNST